MIWLYYMLLLAVAAVGLCLSILGLPGLWLIVAGGAGYAWWTGFGVYIGWPALVALIALAIVADIIELLAGSAGAAKAGGSKRAMIGAIFGALLGGIVQTGLVPIPLVGTVFGACAGAFIGAATVELLIRRDVAHSFRVGTGAARGRFWGIVTKLGFGCVMFTILLVVALPIGSQSRSSPIPTTRPASGHTN